MHFAAWTTGPRGEATSSRVLLGSTTLVIELGGLLRLDMHRARIHCFNQTVCFTLFYIMYLFDPLFWSTVIVLLFLFQSGKAWCFDRPGCFISSGNGVEEFINLDQTEPCSDYPEYAE